MTTQMFLKNRLVFQRGPNPFRPSAHNDTTCHPEAAPIDGFRVGEAWHDPEDKLNYRVVAAGVLTPAGGWASAAFWMKRWKIQEVEFRELVERGLLDPAIEVDTEMRRYRCLDEGKTMMRLALIREQKKRRSR